MVLSQVALPPCRAEAGAGNVTGEATEGEATGGEATGGEATGGELNAGIAGGAATAGFVQVVGEGASAGSKSRRCRLTMSRAPDWAGATDRCIGCRGCNRWTKYTIGPAATVPHSAKIVSQRRLLRWATW
jgi:hypothetical protein